MSNFDKMDDEYLIKTYVPNVYQKSIYNIDYEKLKEYGIKLISFDIDDTIESLLTKKPSKEAITLFEKLRLMGFELFLISNANYDRVKLFGEVLKTDIIPRAEKPYTNCFEIIKKRYLDKHGIEINTEKMAHVGNSMIKDIAAGNSFGVTTCLVRDVGMLNDTGRFLNPIKTDGEKVRDVLLKRGIWRQHHLNSTDDQYYQLYDTYKSQNNQKDQ